MLIIIISRSSLKLDHVGSKTRLLGHQATQVSDLGPLWPSYVFSSLFIFFKKHFLSTGEIKIAVIINYYLVDFGFIF